MTRANQATNFTLHAPTVESPEVIRQQVSYVDAVTAFDSAESAGGYPEGYNGSFRQQREQRVVEQLIRQYPAGGHILDLPCGAGRGSQLLIQGGHRITAVDSSKHMVEKARQIIATRHPAAMDRCEFVTGDAADTGFADESFDGVWCQRLFHHFHEPQTRIHVLSEFARLSRGPVIVSFANSFALSVVAKRLKFAILGRDLGNYRPIPMSTMVEEFQAAGLSVTLKQPVCWGMSRLWYVVGIPDAVSARKAG
ncbi:MAG: class I SAM-dependent methyltransferase [Planctomycetaceae bacterium]